MRAAAPARRRLTVAEHEAFRREVFPPPASMPDRDDELIGDPLIERRANLRKESDAARVLAILDDIARNERRAS